jgi:small GTP-binding protein
MRKTTVDFKLVVLGAASVGKTSVIQRYCNNMFESDTAATIGAGFFVQQLTIGGRDISVILWDTVGEERFRTVIPSMLKGANALILVFDLIDQQSFEALDFYLETFLDNVDTSRHAVPPVLVLGNKSDLGNDAISPDQLDGWLTQNRIQMYHPVSAKTGEGIQDAFGEFITKVVQPPDFSQVPPLHFLVPKETGDSSTRCC